MSREATSLAITEDELARLIEASSRENFLSCSWGSGRLPVIPKNAWALRLLAEWRGVEVPS